MNETRATVKVELQRRVLQHTLAPESNRPAWTDHRTNISDTPDRATDFPARSTRTHRRLVTDCARMLRFVAHLARQRYYTAESMWM